MDVSCTEQLREMRTINHVLNSSVSWCHFINVILYVASNLRGGEW